MAWGSKAQGHQQRQQPCPPKSRRVVFFLLIPAMLVGIGFLVLAKKWPYTQARTAQALQEAFDGKVSFASFKSTYFPPGCVAEGVVFTRPTTPPEFPPLVTVRRLVIRARYTDFIFRPGYVARVILEGFHLRVPPLGSTANAASTRNDTSKSSTLIGKVIADGAVVEIARREGHEPLRFLAHSLSLSSVSRTGRISFQVTLSNPLPPGEIRSSGHFGPWNSDHPGQTPVFGTYAFEQAKLDVFEGIAGTLSSEGEFRDVLERIQVNGTTDVPDFGVRRSGHTVHLKTRFDVAVNGMNGDVALHRVDGSFLQTKVTATGNIVGRPGQRGKSTSLNLTVEQGRIQHVLHLFVREPKPPLNGVTSFRAHVTILPLHQPFLREVTLTGDFGIGGGQFTKPSTQSNVDELSERSSGKKPKNNQESADDPEEDQTHVLSNLSGHVVLQNGIATFTEVTFDVPSAQAQMHGTYNLLDQRIDLHGTLRTDAKFSQTADGVKSVLLKPFDGLFKRKPHGAIIPVQMTGTYSDPHYGLEPGLKKN
jgi:hypothetical protein